MTTFKVTQLDAAEPWLSRPTFEVRLKDTTTGYELRTRSEYLPGHDLEIMRSFLIGEEFTLRKAEDHMSPSGVPVKWFVLQRVGGGYLLFFNAAVRKLMETPAGYSLLRTLDELTYSGSAQ
jgi:hypothetical protein